jgi:hypothetical protein
LEGLDLRRYGSSMLHIVREFLKNFHAVCRVVICAAICVQRDPFPWKSSQAVTCGMTVRGRSFGSLQSPSAGEHNAREK